MMTGAPLLRHPDLGAEFDGLTCKLHERVPGGWATGLTSVRYFSQDEVTTVFLNSEGYVSDQTLKSEQAVSVWGCACVCE